MDTPCPEPRKSVKEVKQADEATSSTKVKRSCPTCGVESKSKRPRTGEEASPPTMVSRVIPLDSTAESIYRLQEMHKTLEDKVESIRVPKDETAADPAHVLQQRRAVYQLSTMGARLEILRRHILTTQKFRDAQHAPFAQALLDVFAALRASYTNTVNKIWECDNEEALEALLEKFEDHTCVFERATYNCNPLDMIDELSNRFSRIERREKRNTEHTLNEIASLQERVADLESQNAANATLLARIDKLEENRNAKRANNARKRERETEAG